MRSSAAALFPRMPRRQLPSTVPNFPSVDLLKAANALVSHKQPTQTSAPHKQTKAPKEHIPAHQRMRMRSLEDVQTARPLPSSFEPGVPLKQAIKAFKASAAANDPPLPSEEANPYPYRYYQVTLMRGLVGLPQSTRAVVGSIGLRKRHHVVWLPVSPASAGAILKIKELVQVRLANSIPQPTVRPTGFTRTSSMIGQHNLVS